MIAWRIGCDGDLFGRGQVKCGDGDFVWRLMERYSWREKVLTVGLECGRWGSGLRVVVEIQYNMELGNAFTRDDDFEGKRKG